VLEVIDWCLRLDPLERPQSVFALQKAIRDIPPKKRKLTVLGNLKRKLFTEIGAHELPPCSLCAAPPSAAGPDLWRPAAFGPVFTRRVNVGRHYRH
jgi:hypothetical protein